jgi:alkanesulfonate monooxygenase SsuD/methylene tetrahydromethanopterin reductase-like flavin-dependent oxidoreductase (luciferase family)
MAPIVIGRTRAEVAARLARGREWFTRVPESEAEWRTQSFLFGSVDEVVRDLRRWQALGIERVMLQCLDPDDLAALELIAREVIPAVA